MAEKQKLIQQDEEFITHAYALFDELYTAATPFRSKCMANEQYYKANHWEGIAKKEPNEPQPVTPVLFSTLEGMLSDIMDNYPEPVLLAQEEGDEGLSQELCEVLKYVLKRRDYRKTYREKCRQALIKGASVQEVYWDDSLYGGMGDVNIRSWDIKHFLFDHRCEDIQQGRACFKYGFYTKEWFVAHYPQAAEHLRPDAYSSGYGDEDEVMVLEYWYKDWVDGKSNVHMAKLAGHVLLERSEAEHPQGMYAHGQYPFVVEPLYRIDGSPIGLGMVDILKNMQDYADKLDQIILKNAMMSGKVKMLINRNAEIDEDALTNWDTEVVRGSRIDDGSVRWFQPAPLNPYVMAHYNSKIAAIKEESGQTSFNRGEANSGVTAASAIMALQEAGSKRSRLIVQQLYDGFESLVRMVIDVICENYQEERIFRIRGGEVASDVVIAPNMLRRAEGDLEGYVEFDIRVQVEKQSPYSTIYQNELAIQMLRAGMIQPQECLSMMSFEGKEKVLQQVQMRQEEAEQMAALLQQSGSEMPAM
ncbi:hypothetical protein LJC55_00230 [Eubacteriales bacterium OttesenSCG-928-N14]|nr:hypothetical protein [Eubacteriales bacterium OttesenSCG-928-N14]